MIIRRNVYIIFTLFVITIAVCAQSSNAIFPSSENNSNEKNLEQSFRNPPDNAKPWVFWLWINGNISREGITKDLEAMKRVGINGVLWMEVSGFKWAPHGSIKPGTKEWKDTMQWAISEADRLGMAFALSVDFGYGCGGPHIKPDISMQKLVWSTTKVQGGKFVSVKLKKPVVDYTQMLKYARMRMRPGEDLLPEVLSDLKDVDSYRDIAVFAVKKDEQPILLGNLDKYDGRGWETHLPPLTEDGISAQPLSHEHIIDLTGNIEEPGELEWSAPPGVWEVVRLGHASNFMFTRPSPRAAVGLECDRLNTQGIDAHFEHHLKPILDAAGRMNGRTLKYIHIDSWEARGQNWCTGFADEFKDRRGYDIEPWLPVLTGKMVQSKDMTKRFLWDMRQTVSELMLENYIDRLRELSAPYGVQFSCEPYGYFCVDNLTYGGRSDLPICEFTMLNIGDLSKISHLNSFRNPAMMNTRYAYRTMKAVASVANTYGKPCAGGEAFTGDRGWYDHPFWLKGMGDEAFAQGINHLIYHLSAHQPYDNMVPGLTHRRWGQHFNRHQTWWEFSKPYFDYVSRCQFLLRQGKTAVDFAILYHEGAPVNIMDDQVTFDCPPGYDYDLCPPETIKRMTFKKGRICLPSGASYRYLVLPKTGRLTLETAQKIEELHKAGATIIRQSDIVGTPGIKGYPEADKMVREMAKKWSKLPNEKWNKILADDDLKPDFEAENLYWIHRCSYSDDIYFIANSKLEAIKQRCTFRITGKTPELWDPETGEIFALSDFQRSADRTSVLLEFEPLQSYFVVFRESPSTIRKKLYSEYRPIQKIEGPWLLDFDPEWGTSETLTLKELNSWTESKDPLVRYYSGIATYRTTFDLDPGLDGPTFLDLGKVGVMAKVVLNGNDLGITWKPPYHVEATDALKTGENKLEIRVVNTWANRLIGDEKLPLDAEWKDWETLLRWPDWIIKGEKSPTCRYTFTSVRHYHQCNDSHLQTSGLLGPVWIKTRK